MKTNPHKIANAAYALANCKTKNPAYKDKQQLIVIPNTQTPAGLCNRTFGGQYNYDMGYTPDYDCCVPSTQDGGVRNSCININPNTNPYNISVANIQPTGGGCNKQLGTPGWYDNGNDSFPEWTCCVKEPIYFPMYLTFANYCKPSTSTPYQYQGNQSVCKPFVYGGTIWVACPTDDLDSVNNFKESITAIAKTGQVKNVILAISPPPIKPGSLFPDWTDQWVTDNLGLMDKCVKIMNDSTLDLLAFATIEERHLDNDQRRVWNARFNANLRMKHPDVKQIYIGLAGTTSNNLKSYIAAIKSDSSYPSSYTGPVFDWIGMDYYPGTDGVSSTTNTITQWKQYQDKYNTVAENVGSKVLIIPYIGNSSTVKANGNKSTTAVSDMEWNVQIKKYMEDVNKKSYLITMVAPFIFAFDPLPTQDAINNDANIQYILAWKKGIEDQYIHPKLTEKPVPPTSNTPIILVIIGILLMMGLLYICKR